MVGVDVVPAVVIGMNGKRRLPFSQSFEIRISDDERCLKLFPRLMKHFIVNLVLLMLRMSFSSTIL